jgi:DNA-binding MarR family transcriptional regulator
MFSDGYLSILINGVIICGGAALSRKRSFRPLEYAHWEDTTRMSDSAARDRDGTPAPQTTLESYTQSFPDADADALATHMEVVATSASFASGIEALIHDLGFDLSRPRYTIVRALYLTPGHALAQSDLAQLLRVSGPNVTQLIDGLVAGGWVERAVSPADRRVVLASLTREGEQRAARLVPAVVDFMVASCGSLTPEERAELRRLLLKVRTAVADHGLAPASD